MNNKTVASKVKLLAALMELHGESSFRYKNYAFAYNIIKKLDKPILDTDVMESGELKGIGSKMASTLKLIAETGTSPELDLFLSKTPAGVVDLLSVKGLGPKKVELLWRNHNIDSVGALIYYCNENRLKDINGFGLKSQQSISESANLFLSNKGQILYAHAQEIAPRLLDTILSSPSVKLAFFTGEFARKSQVLSSIEVCVKSDEWPLNITDLEVEFSDSTFMSGFFKEEVKFSIKNSSFPCKDAVIHSFADNVLNSSDLDLLSDQEVIDERQFFHAIGMPYIIPEHRWSKEALKFGAQNLIELVDIKGIVHTHTTYSDGLHSLAEMVEYVYKNGFEYLVVSDHSQSAGYAGGLKPSDIIKQHIEIDELQKLYSTFKIFKSIECDILRDGSLDYSNEILESFDLVICSVHSVLNMDKNDATARLIKAIEHPNTNILGHLTGRLLLVRAGYELDCEKIFDACAANNVCIELNANPQRLDVDYKYIMAIVERGVKVSINPDAHSKESIHNIKYGVIAGRCGGLNKDSTINTFDAETFLNTLKK